MKYLLFALTFITVFVFLSTLSARRESLTYDEIVYRQEGLAAIGSHTFSIDPYNPPFIQELTVFGGRSVTVVLGLLLLVSVFLFSSFYFNVEHGLFSLFLLTFEPNTLGNSHYVTLDAGFTLFFFLFYVALLRASKIPSVINAVLFGLSLGLALASKITGLTYSIACMILAGRPKHWSIWILVAGFVLWGVYFFKTDVIVVRHDNPDRVSSKIISFSKSHHIPLLGEGMEFLQNKPVPLGTYLSVVKNNAFRSKVSGNSVPLFALLTNFLLKTPLPFIILFFLGIRKKNFMFVIPVIAVLFVASVSRVNPFVRYILPVYPFMAIVAASSFNLFRGKIEKIIFISLVFWYSIGTMSYFPHFIAYANELTGSRERRFEKFVDSNIDWGQSLPDLQKYVSKYKPSKLHFSYFGRDNGEIYGFVSTMPWGGYKFDDICAFHDVYYQGHNGKPMTAISISNWYYCGYSKQRQFSKEKIADVVGDSILIFRQ